MVVVLHVVMSKDDRAAPVLIFCLLSIAENELHICDNDSLWGLKETDQHIVLSGLVLNGFLDDVATLLPFWSGNYAMLAAKIIASPRSLE